MMNINHYVIDPPLQVTVPVAGGGEFPVRRIFCVGRNYADHVREMGGDPSIEKPVFFTKPADAVIAGGAAMHYPPQTRELHHEVELVVAIGEGGAKIAAATALDHVFGYAVGLDMTRRDLQAQYKSKGQPWDMAKAFDQSAPIGAIQRASVIGHPGAGKILLTVNGEVRQQGELGQMILPVAGIIAALSEFVTLAAGDLIFTGTPDGVGPVVSGDLLHGSIQGVGEVRTQIS